MTNLESATNLHYDPYHAALQRDVFDVYIVKTKSIGDFTPDVQQLIRDTYRFTPTLRDAGGTQQVQMIRETVDLI